MATKQLRIRVEDFDYLQEMAEEVGIPAQHVLTLILKAHQRTKTDLLSLPVPQPRQPPSQPSQPAPACTESRQPETTGEDALGDLLADL